MARREFPTKVKVAVIKRATVDNVIFCENCGGLAKRFQIDHVIADALGGEPVLENAMLICEACYSEKNPKDTTLAAKVKRQEARHLGAKRTAGPRIISQGFPKRDKPRRFVKKPLPPKDLFR